MTYSFKDHTTLIISRVISFLSLWSCWLSSFTFDSWVHSLKQTQNIVRDVLSLCFGNKISLGATQRVFLMTGSDCCVKWFHNFPSPDCFTVHDMTSSWLRAIQLSSKEYKICHQSFALGRKCLSLWLSNVTHFPCILSNKSQRLRMKLVFCVKMMNFDGLGVWYGVCGVIDTGTLVHGGVVAEVCTH